MKRKILIVNSSFAFGGIQSSLQNMLECIKDEYDIDLLVLDPTGPFKERVPEDIHVIVPDWRFASFGMSQSACLKRGSIKQIVFRTFCAIWARLINNHLPIKMAIRHNECLSGYDAAIAYRHEGKKDALNSGYISFISDCVDAKRRLSWIHNDNASFPLDEAYNETSYDKVDKIVGVSKAVIDGFKQLHPNLAWKCDYCYNFINEEAVTRRSKETSDVLFPVGKFICFSACRLSPVKGIPRAVQAIAPVILEHPNIFWYIAGAGADQEAIQKTIAECKMEEHIILMGAKDNPYPYIKNADLIMLLSYHEAAPMLYSEAKLLKTPVFTTRLSSSFEMLGDEAAFICENNEESIRNTFRQIIECPQYLQEKKDWLKKNDFNQDVIKSKFRQLIEGDETLE